MIYIKGVIFSPCWLQCRDKRWKTTNRPNWLFTYVIINLFFLSKLPHKQAITSTKYVMSSWNSMTAISQHHNWVRLDITVLLFFKFPVHWRNRDWFMEKCMLGDTLNGFTNEHYINNESYILLSLNSVRA